MVHRRGRPLLLAKQLRTGCCGQPRTGDGEDGLPEPWRASWPWVAQWSIAYRNAGPSGRKLPLAAVVPFATTYGSGQADEVVSREFDTSKGGSSAHGYTGPFVVAMHRRRE